MILKKRHIISASYYSLTTNIISVVAILVFIILVLAFLLPFIFAILPAFSNTPQSHKINFFQNQYIFRIVKSALYTLKISFTSTIIALILGIPGAFFLARRSFKGRNLLKILASVPLCTPPLLIALGFVMAFGMNGEINKIIGRIFNTTTPTIQFLYSFWGIVIAQGVYNFPIIMETCAIVWEKLPQDEYDAARLLGASKNRIFMTITIRQLLPSIASSSALVFLFCFFSFLIVLLFGSIGGSTLEVEIYNAARTNIDFSQAARLAITETVIALFALTIWALLDKKNNRSSGIFFGNGIITRKKIVSKSEKLLFFVFSSIIILFLLFPIGLIFGRGLSSNSMIELFKRPSFPIALRNTILISSSSALLATMAAGCFSIFIKKIDPLKNNFILRTIPLIPMAVSSVVLGMGFTHLIPVGNVFMLVLAEAAITWPFAFKQITSQIDRIPIETIEAATLLSNKKNHLIFKIYIPMSKKGFISSLAFCFAIASGDATLPLVMGIPRFETLALFTYRLASSYRFSQACASGTILLIIASLVFYIGKLQEEK